MQRAAALKGLGQAYAKRLAWLEEERAVATASALRRELDEVEGALAAFSQALDGLMTLQMKLLSEKADRAEGLADDYLALAAPLFDDHALVGVDAQTIQMRQRQADMARQLTLLATTLDQVSDQHFMVFYACAGVIMADERDSAARAAFAREFADAGADALLGKVLTDIGVILLRAVKAAKEASSLGREEADSYLGRLEAFRTACLDWATAANLLQLQLGAKP